ncbi:MAG: hypothetical protein KAQ88_07285 [Hyphomicrobiaceae bacterium]|nr:hypothetical protein [Hyphomicrobiaceae bacterium]
MGASTRTPAQFRDAVRTAFGAHWTAAGELLDIVAWDNVSFNPRNLQAYVFASLAHATGELASLGTGSEVQVRRVAIFAAQIFVRHNTGQQRADDLSEIILDFLESTHLQGIRIRDTGVTEAGRVQQWFQVNVNAQIEYDSFRSV